MPKIFLGRDPRTPATRAASNAAREGASNAGAASNAAGRGASNAGGEGRGVEGRGKGRGTNNVSPHLWDEVYAYDWHS